jgi:hypothetical protein
MKSLSELSASRGDDYEELYLLGYDAVQLTEVYSRFERTYYFHLQASKNKSRTLQATKTMLNACSAYY